MEEKEMGRKRTPGEEARRELIRELLSNANVTGMEDIQRLFRETIAEFLEGSLDAELDETLVMGDMTILPEPNQEQQTAETVIAGKP